MTSELKLKVALTTALVVFCGFVVHHYRHASDRIKTWDADKARTAERPIPVRLCNISVETLDEIIGGTCVSQPSQTVEVFAGRPVPKSEHTIAATPAVETVFVKEGDWVKAGAPLVKLRDAMLLANRDERETALKLLKQRLELMHTALALKEVVERDVVALRQEFAEASLAYRAIVAQLEDTTIVSPIEGVIQDITVANGSIIESSDPVATVFSIHPLQVVMDYPISQLGKLKVGAEAEITLDGFQDETFTGKIIAVSPVADSETRVLPVTIEIDNSDGRLKGGLPGFVRIRQTMNGIRIPSTALMPAGNGFVVFCSDGLHVHLQQVVVGTRLADGYVLIEEGLQASAQVVVAGHHALVEGDRVNPDWKGWANRTDATKTAKLTEDVEAIKKSPAPILSTTGQSAPKRTTTVSARQGNGA